MAQKNSFPSKAIKQLAIGLRDSTASISTKFRKHATIVARKLSRPDLIRPRQLMATFSNRTIRFKHKRRDIEDDIKMDGCDDGEFGLWQRSILMGEKCEPLNFSGVIFYDNNGKKIDELPVRSPRLSPLP